MEILLDFGKPKNFQKSIKNRKNRVRDDVVARMIFMIDFGSDCGWMLVDFWLILGRFWKEFGQFLARIFLPTIIRMTKGKSMDGWIDEWMDG